VCSNGQVNIYIFCLSIENLIFVFFIRMFSASIHGLRNRIVRIFLRTFHSERLPLVTHYGALVGLCEMGQEVNNLLINNKLTNYFFLL
jgi:hypothetical protein